MSFYQNSNKITKLLHFFTICKKTLRYMWVEFRQLKNKVTVIRIVWNLLGKKFGFGRRKYSMLSILKKRTKLNIFCKLMNRFLRNGSIWNKFNRNNINSLYPSLLTALIMCGWEISHIIPGDSHNWYKYLPKHFGIECVFSCHKWALNTKTIYYLWRIL